MEKKARIERAFLLGIFIPRVQVRGQRRCDAQQQSGRNCPLVLIGQHRSTAR